MNLFPAWALSVLVLSQVIAAALRPAVGAQYERTQITVAEPSDVTVSLSTNKSKVVLTPNGDLRPIGYLWSNDLTNALQKWKSVTGIIGVDDGAISLNAPSVPTFYKSLYLADPKQRNDYFAYTNGLDLTQPHTLAIFLHGDTPVSNSGYYLESFIADWFTQYGALCWCPTSLRDSLNNANWNYAATSSDFARLETGIRAIERVANVDRIAIIGYSSGAPAAISFGELMSQTRPGRVNCIVAIAGGAELSVSTYFRNRNGGKPITFDPAIECVTMTSPGDSSGADTGVLPLLKDMERANGETNAPVELAELYNVNQMGGANTKITRYGSHVWRFQIVGTGTQRAPNHDDSQVVSDPGADLMYRDGVINGRWPGQ